MTTPGSRAPETGTEAAESDHKIIKRMLVDLATTTEIDEIHGIVQSLAAMLPEHFDGEEGPDGLYEELRLMQPGLSPKLDGLARDHGGLRREMDELVARCGQLKELHERLCALKDDFIAHLTRHEAIESGLVADAYYIDLGESG